MHRWKLRILFFRSSELLWIATKIIRTITYVINFNIFSWKWIWQSNWHIYRPASLAVRFRFSLESYGLTIRGKLLMIYWHFRCCSSSLLVERYCQVFESKNNTNWSLAISPIQIGKLRINAWTVLACLYWVPIF